MKPKKAIVHIVFLFFCIAGLQAQESLNTAGGEATGLGGSVSYSIGQVVYTTEMGTIGSVAQGVQQAYEISTVVGIEETFIQLEMVVYPNPTTDFLQLKIENQAFEGLSFQMYNTQGQLIQNNSLMSNHTNISMKDLVAGTYFLKITDHNKIIKTFKVMVL